MEKRDTQKIFIVAPASFITGGVELCHQLGDVLNQQTKRAWMLYFPFGDAAEVPEPYQRYNVTPGVFDDVDDASIIVMPEVFVGIISTFRKCQIFLWWLSVDNFLDRARRTRTGKVFGRSLGEYVLVRRLRKANIRHLYQSEYARQYLRAARLEPADRLSDYLADEYDPSNVAATGEPREVLITYNPAKGIGRTKSILAALESDGFAAPRTVALEGMTRGEIRALLSSAMLYIDFGRHPGKDRIPREAVALGACLVVNRRGSARNSVDIPIPDAYKIDDTRNGFEVVAARKIRRVIQNFPAEQSAFESYRKIIANERARFISDVGSIFTPEP